MMSISVVIPTFNCGTLVTRAIDSVLAQTLPPYEIIVVDDGSTDDTLDRLRPYMHRVRYVHQHNQGASVARNLGIAHACGNLVAFLDSDDLWHPRKLEIQYALLKRHPHLQLLGTRLNFTPRHAELPADLDPASLPVTLIPWTDLVVSSELSTPTIVVNRHRLLECGGFDPQLLGSEDRDLWQRLARHGVVGRVEVPLVSVGDRIDSLSKNASLMEVGGTLRLRKLDRQREWGGRRMLRRQAYGNHYLSCCYAYSARMQHARAMFCLLRSGWWYPFAFKGSAARPRFVRVKTFVVLTLRMLGLKRDPEMVPGMNNPVSQVSHG